LHFLPKCENDASLKRLLKAAKQDSRLHQARIQAAVHQNPKLLRTYKVEKDEEWKARQERRQEHVEMLERLQHDSNTILHELSESEDKQGLTQAERVQVKLARWQRALELFVYAPAHMQDVDMLGLLEKLLQGSSEVRRFIVQVVGAVLRFHSTNANYSLSS
jgi:hypothetical protein